MPPTVIDQKRAELLLYKLLNQGDSPAARMKVTPLPPCALLYMDQGFIEIFWGLGEEYG